MKLSKGVLQNSLLDVLDYTTSKSFPPGRHKSYFSHHGNGLCYHRDVNCNGTPCPTTPNGTVCGDISIYDILKDWNELHLFNGDTLPEGHIRRPTQVLQIAVMVESNFGKNE